MNDRQERQGPRPTRLPALPRRRLDGRRRGGRLPDRGDGGRGLRPRQRRDPRPLSRDRSRQGVLPHQRLRDAEEVRRGLKPCSPSAEPARPAAPSSKPSPPASRPEAMDRRAFLRRSGLAAGGLAAVGTLSARGGAQGRGPHHAGHGDGDQEERLHPLLRRLHGHGRGAERGLGRPGALLREPDQPRHPLRQGRVGPRARGRGAPPQVPDEARRRRVAAHLLGPGDQRDRRQAPRHPREARGRIRCSGSAPPSSPTRAPTCSASSAPSGAPTPSTIRPASATRPRWRASPTPGATARRPTPTTTCATPRPWSSSAAIRPRPTRSPSSTSWPARRSTAPT